MRSPGSRSERRSGTHSRKIEGYLVLEYLGPVLVFSPVIGLLFTSFWSVGIALIAVVAPLTWLGRGGKMPAWMLADPETVGK